MGLLSQQQPQPQQAQQQGRKANEQEQAAYKNVVTQVISFLARPQVSAKLEEMVQQQGPEQALAMVIIQALQMVGKAAQGAGADIATHTGKAAIKEIVMVMTSMMKAGGLVQDAQKSAAGTMQIIAEMLFGSQGQPQEQPQEQPQQPQAGIPQAEPAQPQMGA